MNFQELANKLLEEFYEVKPLMKKETIDENGRRSIKFVRASILLEVTDQNGRTSDERTESIINSERERKSKDLVGVLSGALYNDFLNNRVDKDVYDDMMSERDNCQTTDERMQWCQRVGLVTDVFSVEKVVRYAVLKDENGIVMGMKKLGEGAEGFVGDGEIEEDEKNSKEDKNDKETN